MRRLFFMLLIVFTLMLSSTASAELKKYDVDTDILCTYEMTKDTSEAMNRNNWAYSLTFAKFYDKQSTKEIVKPKLYIKAKAYTNKDVNLNCLEYGPMGKHATHLITFAEASKVRDEKGNFLFTAKVLPAYAVNPIASYVKKNKPFDMGVVCEERNLDGTITKIIGPVMRITQKQINELKEFFDYDIYQDPEWLAKLNNNRKIIK